MNFSHIVGVTLVGGVVAVAVGAGLIGGTGELETARAEHSRLHRVHHDTVERHRYNRTVVLEVMAGRASLADGADLLWRANAHEAGYVNCLERSYAAPTAKARAARNLIARASAELRDEPARHDEVVARLEADYAREFGPGPEHPGVPDQDH